MLESNVKLRLRCRRIPQRMLKLQLKLGCYTVLQRKLSFGLLLTSSMLCLVEVVQLLQFGLHLQAHPRFHHIFVAIYMTLG